MTNRKPSPAPADAPPTEPAVTTKNSEIALAHSSFTGGATMPLTNPLLDKQQAGEHRAASDRTSATPAPQAAEIEQAMERIANHIEYLRTSASPLTPNGEHLVAALETLLTFCRTQQREAAEADGIVDKIADRILEESCTDGLITNPDMYDLAYETRTDFKGRYALRQAQGELSEEQVREACRLAKKIQAAILPVDDYLMVADLTEALNAILYAPSQPPADAPAAKEEGV